MGSGRDDDVDAGSLKSGAERLGGLLVAGPEDSRNRSRTPPPPRRLTPGACSPLRYAPVACSGSPARTSSRSLSTHRMRHVRTFQEGTVRGTQSIAGPTCRGGDAVHRMGVPPVARSVDTRNGGRAGTLHHRRFLVARPSGDVSTLACRGVVARRPPSTSCTEVKVGLRHHSVIGTSADRAMSVLKQPGRT